MVEESKSSGSKKNNKDKKNRKKAADVLQEGASNFSGSDSNLSNWLGTNQNISDIDSEVPLSQMGLEKTSDPNSSSTNPEKEQFNDSEAAAQHLADPEFLAIYERFNELKEEQDLIPEDQVVVEDLIAEDDYGNIEYKLKLCDLSMYKVRSRTTQMAFRLTVSVRSNRRHC